MSLANFVSRTLSAVVLTPIALAAIYYGGTYYKILILIAAGISLFELKNMILKDIPYREYKEHKGWIIFSFFYVLIPAYSLIYLRNFDPVYGFQATVWMFVSVWCTDVGGYIFGRLIGGPKLIPALSPKKTWAGLIGAILLSVVFGYYFGLWFTTRPQGSGPFDGDVEVAKWFMVFSGLVTVVAQAGDFFESWIKRTFGVKDSGNLIPGHGGLLDRIDGLLFVAPITALTVYVHLLPQ
ncbi:MAG: phosphatidate cytidylyltransferase [Proteobacteria bacterium]|nr:phosphatidate cytidylyltransferase [Pseudomonadota bacterium]